MKLMYFEIKAIGDWKLYYSWGHSALHIQNLIDGDGDSVLHLYGMSSNAPQRLFIWFNAPAGSISNLNFSKPLSTLEYIH